MNQMVDETAARSPQTESQQEAPGSATEGPDQDDGSLGEALVAAGKLKEADLTRALRVQRDTGQPLGDVLVRLGLVAERDVVEILSEQLGVPVAASEDYPDLPIFEEALSRNFLKRSRLLPLWQEDHELAVAMADPRDRFAQEAVRMATGCSIRPLLATPSEIENAFERLYGSGRSSMGQIVEAVEEEEQEAGELDDIEQLRDMASEAPVIRIVNLIISRALEARASDIHIEPFEHALKVRYRIDGVMHEIEPPPTRLTAAIISRVKIMSRLNIAERRLPQDGRIQLRIQGREIDLRVSTVPTLYGESVVMRILDKESVALDLEQMGFSPENLKRFKWVLKRPNGIMLVTGPTGSGKTTTLYAALTRLNTPESKILTVEDPVEYQLAGINQIQVKPKIGLGFADSLRAIVRQDPDIIMIGEMRDLETARIAVQSALTGHLVLSTVHTNDAASGVTRLLDMGIEDYLLSSTITGIMAQRLVRRLCTHCRQEQEASAEAVQDLQLERYADAYPIRLWQAQGCPHCSNTGYRGRTAIHELLIVDDSIRRLVLQHAEAGAIQRAAREAGMHTMYEDGLYKALQGVTTVEEVLRVTQDAGYADV